MKKIFRIIAVLLSALMLFSLAACGKGDSGYRIAYISRAQSDSFGIWLTNAIKIEAAKYPNVTVDVFDSQSDSDTEINHINNAIAAEYDCIIIQPQNGELIRPYAEKIIEAGIALITTNPKIDGIVGSSMIDADPYAQAKVNCDLAFTIVPQNAKVVVFKGPEGNFHADERRQAWRREFFDKRPDVTIINEEHADWSKDRAYELMKEWTANGETIDAVISMNDDMCVGALYAVESNAQYENMLAFGVDGTSEALFFIKEGRMTSTCMQNANELAALIMETAYSLITKTETSFEKNIGNPLVTAENVDEYIEMLKAAGTM
ncbi:MAG: sugar ABC transporter substrate-binding protein [Ruminococcus sp.]|jgi:inositol transport system substrate-binding protein|nr:sugar ABC transporter substrate-binding protein [Ruminococcus sp.]